MFQEQHTEKKSELWRKFVEREFAYIQTRQEFLNCCTGRVAPIKKALHNPTEREIFEKQGKTSRTISKMGGRLLAK